MSLIQVDQSGRIEIPGETIIAASNSFTVTVRITPQVQQAVRDKLLLRGVKPRMVMIRMFVAGIYIAIHKNLKSVHSLIIDVEYPGYEDEIKSLLLEKIRTRGHWLSKHNIVIMSVGKKSPAHHAAIRVFRKQAKADYTPTVDEMFSAC